MLSGNYTNRIEKKDPVHNIKNPYQNGDGLCNKDLLKTNPDFEISHIRKVSKMYFVSLCI